MTTIVESRRRLRLPSLGSAGSVLAPVVVALLVGAVVVAVTGNDPVSIYRTLAREAFGGADRVNATLAAATPLLFTGLAAAFAYRAGIFTVGVEGSFVAGGLATAAIGSHMDGVVPALGIAALLVVATFVGLVVAVLPAVLRAYARVDEVVTTLMFNFIASGLASWSVQAFFQERGQANSATAMVADAVRLPELAPPGQTNVGLLVALAAVAVYWWWTRSTTLGFELTTVGSAPRFAVAQGLRTRLVVLVALLGAGAIGGLAGGVHTLGIVHRFTAGFSAGFGFTGIAIALLARFNPVGIVAAAILFGALNSAGTTAQLFIDLPIQIIDVLQGTVMVFAVAQFALPRLRKRQAVPVATT